MPSAESFIQVPPNSSGSSVRNLQLGVVEADGTTRTVLMQVVTVADMDGNPINAFNDADTMREILGELRAVRRGLEILVGTLLDPDTSE